MNLKWLNFKNGKGFVQKDSNQCVAGSLSLCVAEISFTQVYPTRICTYAVTVNIWLNNSGLPSSKYIISSKHILCKCIFKCMCKYMFPLLSMNLFVLLFFQLNIIVGIGESNGYCRENETDPT